MPKTRSIALLMAPFIMLGCTAGTSSPMGMVRAESSVRGPLVIMRTPYAAAASGKTLFDVWLDSTGTRGWAVGQEGLILRYEKGEWRVDETSSELTRQEPLTTTQ